MNEENLCSKSDQIRHFVLRFLRSFFFACGRRQTDGRTGQLAFDAGNSFGDDRRCRHGSSNLSLSSSISFSILNHLLQVNRIDLIGNHQIQMLESSFESRFNFATVLFIVQPPAIFSRIEPTVLLIEKRSVNPFRFGDQVGVFKVVFRHDSSTDGATFLFVEGTFGTEETEHVATGQSNRKNAFTQTDGTIGIKLKTGRRWWRRWVDDRRLRLLTRSRIVVAVIWKNRLQRFDRIRIHADELG